MGLPLASRWPPPPRPRAEAARGAPLAPLAASLRRHGPQTRLYATVARTKRHSWERRQLAGRTRGRGGLPFPSSEAGLDPHARQQCQNVTPTSERSLALVSSSCSSSAHWQTTPWRAECVTTFGRPSSICVESLRRRPVPAASPRTEVAKPIHATRKSPGRRGPARATPCPSGARGALRRRLAATATARVAPRRLERFDSLGADRRRLPGGRRRRWWCQRRERTRAAAAVEAFWGKGAPWGCATRWGDSCRAVPRSPRCARGPGRARPRACLGRPPSARGALLRRAA